MSGQMIDAVFCEQCGAKIRGSGAFCERCGTAQLPTPPASGGAGPREARTREPPASYAQRPAPEWQQALPGPFKTIPLELLTVCGLTGLAGVLTLWPVLQALPDLFKLLGASGFTLDLALLLIMVWLILGFFGVTCLLLAWRLAHADRVARGVSYVLLGGMAAAILLGNVHDTQLTLVMLACCGAVGVLWLSPNVRAFFAGVGAPDSGQPVSIVVARTLTAVWGGCVVLVGLIYLPLGSLGSVYLPVGLLLIASGIGAFVLNNRVVQGDETARRILSGGAVVYLILLLTVGRADPGLLLPLALLVGVVWNLWFPQESQRFFGAQEAREAV